MGLKSLFAVFLVLVPTLTKTDIDSYAVMIDNTGFIEALI